MTRMVAKQANRPIPLHWAILPLCFTSISCQGPATETSIIPKPGLDAALSLNAGHLEAGLDDDLSRGAYEDVSRQISLVMAGKDDAARQRVLNWELRKELDGRTDSVLIMSLYSVSLYAQATNADEPDRSRWMKLAVTAYLRTLGTILTEGGQCRDPLATDHRLGQLSQAMEPIQRVLKAYSPPDRQAVARESVLLMQVSFAKRYPDDWLCGGAFTPYALWGDRREAALKALRKGFLLPPDDTASIPKDPKIALLYG